MPVVVAALVLVVLGVAQRRTSGGRPSSSGGGLPYGATLPGGTPGTAAVEEQWQVPTSKEEAIKQGADYAAKQVQLGVSALTSNSGPFICGVYKAKGTPYSQWPESVRKICPRP